MSRMLYWPSHYLLLLTLIVPQAVWAEAKSPVSAELVIDSVLASIDGKPITLRDVSKRLMPPRELTLKDAARDVEVRQILERLIFERLILEEAEARRLKVSDNEIKSYLEEVAKRNSMSSEQLEQALKAEHRDIESYKEHIKIEILKSRLTAQLVQGGGGVTQQEIDEYLKGHTELSKKGSKVKLRQIFISFYAHGEEGARARLAEVQKKLDDGDDFAKVASQFSDGFEAKEGGVLGVIAEKDLSAELFEAIFSLKEDEVSAPVNTPEGIKIFWVEKRYLEDDKSGDSQLTNEVRKVLEEQKLETKMNAFFTTELPAAHAVDRKI